ncbi:protein of unknown function, partial [Salegentibacter echinorum]
MKKYIFISALVWLSSFSMLSAQTTNVLDTIYANDQKNVALFFPEPIRQGVTGSDNFVFTYNRDTAQHFGLLQAKPGKASNLLIISNTGVIFSYIVQYKKKLKRLNYFIDQNNSIGNEKPIKATVKAKTQQSEVGEREAKFERFAAFLLNRKEQIGRIKKRKQKIVLRVDNIVFDKSELYFVIQIENKSTLDYDVNFLKFSVATRQKGKRKSLQEIGMNPIFKYNMPTKIPAKQTV